MALKVWASANFSGLKYSTPPMASEPYNKEAGPLITSTLSTPASFKPKPCSSPNCWFSNRTPCEYTKTRLPLKPRITGFPMEVPVEICETPGIVASPSIKVEVPFCCKALILSCSTFITFCDCILLKGVDTITSSISRILSSI